MQLLSHFQEDYGLQGEDGDDFASEEDESGSEVGSEEGSEEE